MAFRSVSENILDPTKFLPHDGKFTMTRFHWWLGVALIVAAIVFHATFPRYEWRNNGRLFHRVDRWRGTVEQGEWQDGRWIADQEAAAERQAFERELEELRKAAGVPPPDVRSYEEATADSRRNLEEGRNIAAKKAQQPKESITFPLTDVK